MAITSVGYPGTVNAADWARTARHLGAAYFVSGANDWKVETVSGVDRTVRILPGTGGGHGVVDTSDTQVTVQLPTIASGTRWDLVCARRTWGTTNATTFTHVQGTSAQTIPAGRNATPGTLDDQPLALVQVTAGQTLPTAVIDLRVWASKLLTASSLLAFGDADYGTEVRLASGVRYWRGLNDVGALQWQLDQDTYWMASLANVVLNATTAAVTPPVWARVRSDRVRVNVEGDLQAVTGSALVQLQVIRGTNLSAPRVATFRRRLHGGGGAFRESVALAKTLAAEPTGSQTYRAFGYVESGATDVVAFEGMTLTVENI